jgi:hypothetical protein
MCLLDEYIFYTNNMGVGGLTSNEVFAVGGIQPQSHPLHMRAG